jgi:hypothetical protein
MLDYLNDMTMFIQLPSRINPAAVSEHAVLLF